MFKFLSSMKFGIFLMVLIIISSIISTIIPVSSDDTFFMKLLIITLPKIMMIFLCINLLFCTFKRLPGVWKIFRRDITIKDVGNSKVENYNIFKLQDDIKIENTEHFFQKKKYKYRKKADENKIHFAAYKGKISIIAPHLLHIGLAVVLIGGIYGSYFGAEDRISIGIGETVKVPEKITQDMLITLNDFKTVYDKNNEIDNWESDISINYKGKNLVQGVTKVNHPFKYKGVVFYQSAYGYLHKVTVNTGMGEIERVISNRKMDQMLSSYLGQYFIIDKVKDGVAITLFESNNKYQTTYLKEGEIIEFPNGSMTYLGTDSYTVLSVKKDPGTSLVMLGFIIMSLTSFIFWFGGYREVRITLDLLQKKAYVNIIAKGKTTKEEILKELEDIYG